MGQTFRQLLRNLFASFAAKLAVRVLSFVVMVLQANFLGPQRFGVYVEILSFVFILLAFIDLGWSAVMIRQIGREPSSAPRCLANFLALETFASVLFAAALIAFFFAAGYPREQCALVSLAAIGLFFGGLNRAPAAALVARQRVDATMLVELCLSLAASLGALGVIWRRGGLAAFIWVNNLQFVGLFAANCAVARRLVGPLGWRVDGELWRRHFRQGFLSLISAGGFALTISLDVAMLSKMVADEAMGVYGVAVRLTNPLMLFMEATMLAVFPVLSARHESDLPSFRFLLDKSIKAMLAVGLPIGLGLTLLARDIVGVLFPQFGPSAPILAVLVWRLPLLFVYAPLNHALLAAGRFKALAAINVAAVALNFGLNLALIPRWGLHGAAAATVLTHGAILLCYLAGRRRFYRFGVSLGDAARLAAALAVMAGGLAAWGWSAGPARSLLGLGARVALGAALFFGPLLGSGFVGKDEAPYLQREWRRLRGTGP